MSILLDYTCFQNLDNLLRFQNHILIRKISQDKNWPLEELKKFIPAKVKATKNEKSKIGQHQNKKELSTIPAKEMDSPNFKVIQKRIVKKKVRKVTPRKEKALVKQKVNDEKQNQDKTKISPPKKKKKAIRKKIVKKKLETEKEEEELQPLAEDEVEVILIEFNTLEYYLDPKTDKVYEKIDDSDILNFIGMKEGKHLNMDAESAED